MSQRASDSATGMTPPIRATVEDAAKLLGLSENAVRKRLERGTLRSEKVKDTRYVLLDDADMPRHAASMSASYLSTCRTSWSSFRNK